MEVRIGYLVPEFPGQTHIFFWREISALETMGAEIDLVSTQRPPSQIMSHTWTSEAEERTTYLFPPHLHLVGIIGELIRSGPGGWLRCLEAISNAKGVSLSRRLRLFALALIGAELSSLARTRGWKHVHIHSCADAANIAMFASLLSQLPYSMTLHGPINDYGPNQEQKWRFAKFAIVITQKLYGDVSKRLAGYLPDKVEIAPMGVDASVFKRQTPYQPWHGDGPCRIFSCGRLNRGKGHADLITAINILRRQGIKAKLEIAGEDEQGGTGYRQDLEKLIQQFDLNHSVRLLGAVSEEVVRDSLEKAHLFALASLREPLGVAIMEAMAMAVPVVVTGAGGVKELVDDGVNGLLVKPRSPEQLAKSIARLLADRELSISLGKAGHEKITQSFDCDRSAKVLIKSIN